jgi:hypothetical protein
MPRFAASLRLIGKRDHAATGLTQSADAFWWRSGSNLIDDRPSRHRGRSDGLGDRAATGSDGLPESGVAAERWRVNTHPAASSVTIVLT